MIERLIIKNFRSIEEVDIKLGKINAFIGSNSSGKSNIMAALNLVLGEIYPSVRAFDDKDFHNYDSTNPIEIQVKFDRHLESNTGVHGFSLTYDGGNCNYYAIDQNGEVCTYYTGGREIRVSSDMKEEVSLMYLGLDRQAYQQIKATKWTIYGKLLNHIEKTIDATRKERFKEDVEASYQSNVAPNLTFIGRVKDFVKEQTGLELDFKLSPLYPSEILKSLRPWVKEPNLQIELDAEDVGAGTQSALAIAIARAYAEIVRKPLIMAIEEPELYLHPHACRHFYKLLSEMSSNTLQIVFTTHERSFIDVTNYKSIHLVLKQSGKTKLKSGIELALPSDEEIQTVSKFDDNINEVFFASHAILVEGPTDKIALRLALENQDVDIDKENTSIVECSSNSCIKFIAKLMVHFGVPCYVLTDEDPGNDTTQSVIEEIKDLIGDTNVFLQSPNLEGMLSLSRKPSKEEALRTLPTWFQSNDLPDVYERLKDAFLGD